MLQLKAPIFSAFLVKFSSFDDLLKDELDDDFLLEEIHLLLSSNRDVCNTSQRSVGYILFLFPGSILASLLLTAGSSAVVVSQLSPIGVKLN